MTIHWTFGEPIDPNPVNVVDVKMSNHGILGFTETDLSPVRVDLSPVRVL